MHTYLFISVLALMIVVPVLVVIQPCEGQPSPQSAAVATKDFWDYTTAEWGDGRPHDPVVKGKPNNLCWKLDYQVTVPKTGWYQLVFKSGNFRHDLFVDGKCIYRYQEIPDRLADGWQKAANIPLTAGLHTLRIQRLGYVGFPAQQFEKFELRASGDSPQNSMMVALHGFDVVRTGECVKVDVTSGYTNTPIHFQVLRQDLLHPENSADVVASVNIPASPSLTTKTLEIPCPAEGIFRLQARNTGGTILGAADFRRIEYAVVDTKTFPGSPEEHKTLVHDIDCVAQSDRGQAIDPTRFFECNGKTRISESTAGRYRESNNCTGPEVEKITNPIAVPRTYSGFAYQMTLPKAGVPYLIELDYPDDARRAMALPVSYLKEDGTHDAATNGYSGKSVETGGIYPLSNTMLTHRFIFWAYSREINIGILSQQVGQRAAASRIRIYQFDDDLPVAHDDRMKGRIFAHWYEEAENWRYLVAGDMLARQYPKIAADYLALNRWIRLARYTGMTAINGPAVSYQNAFYDTKTLTGYGHSTYSQIRLTALLCEKYRMNYIPEVFPGQWYRNKVELPSLANNPDDVKNTSAHGLKGGESTVWNDMNFMNPLVQKGWGDAFAEIGDQLRDSPAFGGISIRLDSWLCYGDWCFTGLLWGYDDLTVKQFQQETGISVPGTANDLHRFAERYRFLTTGSLRERWIAWRCSKVLDYHRRLRDAFSGPRKDVNLYLVGDGYLDPLRDEGVAGDDNPLERFREDGIDTKALQQERGIALIPSARYGSRDTGVADQQGYDGFSQQNYVTLGMNRERGFAAYMVYHELGGQMPFDKLGVNMKNFYYCSCIDAAGRNSLEKYAVVLAEQDSSFLRNGGNTYVFGDPVLYGRWMREYNALPRVPFTRVEGAVDPVAVWQHTKDDGLYFYAVNRERYPVTIDITLQGVNKLFALANGTTVNLQEHTLHLELQPFELRSFRAPSATTILNAVTTVPADQVAFLKDRLVFAQQVADAVTTGAYQGNLSKDDRQRFLEMLSEAWDAFGKKHYWRTRVLLSMAPMMQVYGKVSGYPERQVTTRFPDLLTSYPGGFYLLPKSMLTAETLAGNPTADTKPTILDSTAINSEWGDAKVIMATGGRLQFDLNVPAEGPYCLAIGYVARGTGALLASINGKSLPMPIVVNTIDSPSSSQFPVITLPAGTAHITLRGDLEFGVYGVQLLPVLRDIASEYWATAGPFTTPLTDWVRSGGNIGNEALKNAMLTKFDPESQASMDSQMHDSTGALRTWTLQTISSSGLLDARGVNFATRCNSSVADICYAQTYITTQRACDLLVMVATDWWANLYLNGQIVTSDLAQNEVDATGCWFTTKYFRPVVLHLQTGANRLVCKVHGGTLGNSFMMYALDRPDIVFSATDK